MTEEKTNNQEIVNEVIEEAGETVAEQMYTQVESEPATDQGVYTEAQGVYTADQGVYTADQGVYTEAQGAYTEDQNGFATTTEQYTQYQEGYTGQEPAQFEGQENTQSFADKIDLDEKVAATKNFFGDFWNFIKVSFTQSFPHGVKRAATEKTPFWIVIMVANAVFLGLGILVMVNKIFAPVNALLGMYGGMEIPGGYVFLIGLLASLLFFWAAVGGTIGLLAICKKQFSFQGVCNVVAVAWLPLTLICAANILIGLVYVPLAILLASVGQIMFYILLYMGLQSLAKFQKSPFLWFSLMILVILLVYGLIFGIIINAIAENAMASAMSGFGSFNFR